MIINFNFGDNYNLLHEILEFLKIGLSVFFTGLIGWIAYLKQQRNERLKQDLSNFTLIFCSIQNNINYASAFWGQAQTNIVELKKNILILEKLKECANNINKLRLKTYLNGKENIKLMEYMDSADKLCQGLVFANSYVKIIGELSVNNYEKEALFLTNYGDISFQYIYTSLAKEYVKNNLTLDFINETIDRNTNKATIRTEEVNICDISQEGYEDLINKKIQECFFLLNLYEQLKKSSEAIIFYSDLAFNHLLSFNSISHNKYKKKYKTLGLSSFELNINREYNIEDFGYYHENKATYEKLNRIPSLKL